MLRAAYRWQLRDPVDLDPASLERGRTLGLSARQVRLLAERGVSPEEMPGFVGPPEGALHDPALLPDAERLVERVRRAVAARERVLVFGDFDADGLTGLTILVEALRAMGLGVEFHVPSRVADGHGLSVRAVEHAAASGCRLIVTVDCGTASADEIALASARGIDVVVTDHHQVPPTLLLAAAVVNPQRGDSRYPDPRISGAGVALKVAQALLGGSPAWGDSAGAGIELADLAELAAIGTVADVAPLVGENRAIVRLGLARLRERPRPGLAALLAGAGVATERVDAETLGFVVAPRLNAAGRLGDATVAAELLLTRDPGAAAALAARLEEANNERRTLLGAALGEARVAAGAGPSGEPIVTAVGPWAPGIIGLLAGRLAEEHRRPAIVVSTEVTPWRASARSTNGFDLAAAFAACADLLDRHGGHRDAAGCSLLAAAWDPFRRRLLDLAGLLPPPDPVPTLRVDVAVAASELDYRLFRELSVLEPVGPGNPTPLVAASGLEVLRVRPVGNGHSQVTLRKGREVLDAIAFGRPDIADAAEPGERVEIVARLASREFGGYESLQLEIQDAAPEGGAPWTSGTAAAVGGGVAA